MSRRASLPTRFSRSLMPRYMSQTLYVCVASIVMLAFIVRHYSQQGSEKRAMRLNCIAVALAATIATLFSQQWIYGVHKMEAWTIARLQANASMTKMCCEAPTPRQGPLRTPRS